MSVIPPELYQPRIDYGATGEDILRELEKFRQSQRARRRWFIMKLVRELLGLDLILPRPQ